VGVARLSEGLGAAVWVDPPVLEPPLVGEGAGEGEGEFFGGFFELEGEGDAGP